MMNDQQLRTMLTSNDIETPATLHSGIMRRVRQVQRLRQLRELGVAMVGSFIFAGAIVILVMQRGIFPSLLGTAIESSLIEPAAIPDFLRILAQELSFQDQLLFWTSFIAILVAVEVIQKRRFVYSPIQFHRNLG